MNIYDVKKCVMENELFANNQNLQSTVFLHVREQKILDMNAEKIQDRWRKK